MLEVDARLKQGDFVLDAQFTAPTDAITVLFGPSGSGKSTLLAAIAGLKRLNAGRVVLMGRVGADVKARIHIPTHRRGFGLVFQDARLFPHLTVRQNIAYAHRRAPAQLEVEDVARFFDIAELLGRSVSNLSVGEKSRVALARALVSAPDFLLLDEPFAALDGQRRRAFIAVLREAHKNYRLPLLVVTHSIDDAAALASHVVTLKDGRVVASGDFAGVARQPEFQDLLDPRDSGVVLPANLLRSAHQDAAEGLWLRADHVLLAAERPHAISARNIIEGRVRALPPDGQGSLLVELEIGSGAILARVTPEAAGELGLTPGMIAWAVVKAHAV